MYLRLLTPQHPVTGCGYEQPELVRKLFVTLHLPPALNQSFVPYNCVKLPETVYNDHTTTCLAVVARPYTSF